MHRVQTDAELMTRIQRDADADAFAAFYERHATVALAVARRVVSGGGGAEEAVQDAFVDVWRQRARYSAAVATPRTWLLHIVRNRAIDALRAEQVHSRRRAGDEDGRRLAELPAGEAAADADAVADAAALGDAVRSLPPDQYRVLDLAYFVGLSQSNIAEITGAPLGTVKGRMRLGLAKLRAEGPPRAV